MEIRKEIAGVVKYFSEEALTTDEAIDSILRLLSVVGRSESFVCGHPPKRTYLFDGTWHCEECGGKWESIANK